MEGLELPRARETDSIQPGAGFHEKKHTWMARFNLYTEKIK